jgi:predicted MFS family arabinose efflux permease
VSDRQPDEERSGQHEPEARERADPLEGGPVAAGYLSFGWLPVVLTGVELVSTVPLALVPSVEGVVPLAVVAGAIGVRLSAGPLSNAYIVDTLPDATEGTGWGLLRTAFFAVSSLGSTAVGLLADRGLFDLAFYGLAGLTLVAAGIFVTLPRRDRV